MGMGEISGAGLTLTTRTFVIYEFLRVLANLKAGQFTNFVNPDSRISSQALNSRQDNQRAKQLPFGSDSPLAIN